MNPDEKTPSTDDDQVDPTDALNTRVEAAEAATAAARQAQAEALAALADVTRSANPTIPAELIGGTTPAEIAESVNRARELANRFRAMDAAAVAGNGQKAPAAVPAGGTPAPAPAPREYARPHDRIAAALAARRANA